MLEFAKGKAAAAAAVKYKDGGFKTVDNRVNIM